MLYNVIWPRTEREFNEYMMGLIYGDGQIETKRLTITDSNVVFLKQVAELIHNYWKLKPKIHKRTDANAYYMRIYSVVKVKEIKDNIHAFVDKPTIDFIRGFFDAEGFVYIEQPWRKKYVVIGLSSTNSTVMANIQAILYDHFIYAYTQAKRYYDRRPRKEKTYKIYMLRIKRQSSVKKFLEEVGLRHPRHIVKLKSLCL